MWINFLCVFLGGSIGTACRTELQHLLSAAWYPIGIINLLGSAFLGILAGYFSTQTHNSTDSLWSWSRLFIFLSTGFCGGFTTMSSFVLDLLHARQSNFYVYGILFVASFICTLILYRLCYHLAQSKQSNPNSL